MPLAPLDFSDPEDLRRSMEGASVASHTYWIRFGCRHTTFDNTVENSKVLLKAAERVGRYRTVQFSATNALPVRRLPYFRWEWRVEEILKSGEIPYGITGPTLVFLDGDPLLNNMVWEPRRFLIFSVFGKGDYQIQPFYAEGVAAQAGVAACQIENSVADAAGPDRRGSSMRNCFACWLRWLMLTSAWCTHRLFWASP